jgi:glycine/D-amino acid oxidase-like deaminating enzyme
MRANERQQEHTNSYYAATVNDNTRHPVLQGGRRADVCVVGGGFTGINAALELAERGFDVIVVEANRIGWGASGRNGGQVINGFSGSYKIGKGADLDKKKLLWDLRWRGNKIIFDRVKKYGIDCDLKPGYIEVALKPRHMDDLEQYAARLEQNNFPYEYKIFDRDQTSQILGTEAYIGSMVNMRDGHVHPLNLCKGEARAAASLGVKIFEHSPVTNIRHGEKPRVVTNLGHVDADTVVLAGNAYHHLEGKHLSGLTFPAGSYIIATEPLPQELLRVINTRDYAVCDLNEIVDYYRFSADGRMLYGGRCNYSGREPRSIAAAIAPRMLKTYPQLKDFRIDYEWGGKIGIVIRRIPLLGCIDKNIYYAQGYSGHGVNGTHIMAEILAEAISGTMEKFDMFARMKHMRIPGGQWLGNQALALGMLYYRVKDMR